MRNITILLMFAVLFAGCNRDKSHEGVYLYEDIADKVCSFVSVADNTPIMMACSTSQVKSLNRGDPVYITFSQSETEAKLREISEPLTKMEMQGSWGENCDFYFPLEDTWRELQCSATQAEQLVALGKEPLLLVFYASPTNKGKASDKFYLASAQSYKSEFIASLLYTGEGSQQYACSFHNPKDDSSLLLGCTKTQRAALDRYHRDALLTVKYTDAGELRLLSYTTDKRSEILDSPELAQVDLTAEGDYPDPDNDYETTFQVRSSSGNFVAETSTEELCVFNVTGKMLSLACSQDDYNQLKAEPGRYEIYYTDEDVLFGYEKSF
ncbi:MAG: hypothetical protein LBV04_09575 [Deferribacteraceae bacterium]|jgi:hypothetical protein|nr:hypothetical protein [Deferribacteraceae bacterium]